MKRPLAWSAVFAICGIYLRLGVSEVICLVSFFVVLFLVSYFVTKERSVKYVMFLLFVLLGFAVADARVNRAFMPFQYGGASGEGIVTETGETSSGNQKMKVRCTLEDTAGTRLSERDLYVLWMGEERFAIGDCVVFQGELVPFDRAAYPGGYDEALYLTMKGYDCKMYVEEMRKTGMDTSLAVTFSKGRLRLHNILEQILPAEEGGIMKAMLTGEREDIPEEIQELYMKAGVTHILCISGLHISLLGFYVEILFSRILRCGRGTSTAATIILSTFFLLFTGITPSAVRAVAMLYILLLGRYWFCLYDRRTAIAAAALLILLSEPLYLWHSGFQLSFITVLGISIGAERIEDSRGRERKWFDGIKETFIISWYASVCSFPIVAYHFYSVSLVGVLANLVIIPLSGLLLGFGILSALLGLFSIPAATFAAGSVYVILQIYERTCLLLTELPFAYILTGSPSLVTILLYYALLLFVLYYGEKKWSWLGGTVLCTALWCSIFGNRMFWKENTIAFLDVGQGDAAVITTYDQKAYLIDGGGIYGREFGENTGAMVILPYLEYLGIDELEGAFLSHMDSDHMIGLLETLDALSVKGLYVSDYPIILEKDNKIFQEIVEKNSIPLYTVHNKESSVDGSWECIYPLKGISFMEKDSNLSSMVLRYVYGGTRVLFTGDLPSLGEQLLLERGADFSAEIIKVSHHGAKGASTDGFLDMVSPEIAVISCGVNNLYGHPNEETLERLKRIHAQIYRTDREGSILVRLSPDGSRSIETMAEGEPFYERIKKTME